MISRLAFVTLLLSLWVGCASRGEGSSTALEQAKEQGLAFCGDEVCSTFENCVECSVDCGECTASCGDALCDNHESCVNCPNDCGVCDDAQALCGNGSCADDESCTNCPADCGNCNVENQCGDGQCTAGESCQSCAQDCGACEEPVEDLGLEDEMIRLVNVFRTQGGTCPSGTFQPMGPVTKENVLMQVARAHSADMGTLGYFSHTSQDGRSPFDRINDAGYQGAGRAENIAAGSATAAATFEQWRTSDGHCRNMSNPALNEIGVGYANVNGSPFTHYWTQVFGTR